MCAMNQDTQTRSSQANMPCQANQAMQRISAEDLFRGATVVLIEFQGERYQLRRTRTGKLILTK